MKRGHEFTIRLAEDKDFEQVFAIWLEGISVSFDASTLNEAEVREKFRTNFLSRSGIFNYRDHESQCNSHFPDEGLRETFDRTCVNKKTKILLTLAGRAFRFIGMPFSRRVPRDAKPPASPSF